MHPNGFENMSVMRLVIVRLKRESKLITLKIFSKDERFDVSATSSFAIASDQNTSSLLVFDESLTMLRGLLRSSNSRSASDFESPSNNTKLFEQTTSLIRYNIERSGRCRRSRTKLSFARTVSHFEDDDEVEDDDDFDDKSR